MNKKILIYLIFTLMGWQNINAQETINSLTLDQTIYIALNNSSASLLAKHQFLNGYWTYKIYKSSNLPSMDFRSGSFPSYSNKTESYMNDKGENTFVNRNSSVINSYIDLKQNVFFTGGNLTLSTDINSVGNFYPNSDPKFNYSTTPLSINYRQPLSGYNEFKWVKKIEPLRYEEAKKTYLVTRENIIIQTINNFFNLIEARTNYEMAQLNQFNTDTIYKIAQGRYKMGTITQDELLQTELKNLNSTLNLQQSKVQLEVSMLQFRSYLGLNNGANIIPIVPETPKLSQLVYNEVLGKAVENNDQILSLKISLIEANRRVAEAKKEKGINANLDVSYGLQGNDNKFTNLYNDMSKLAALQVSLNFPIIDWGKGKSRYQIAKSSLEVEKAQNSQALIDFEREVYIKVMNFNLLDQQMRISQKADTIASMRYNLSKQRYIMGNIAIFEFNQAITDKENAKRDYINTLKNYWESIYEIRKLTLYDFINNNEITFNEKEVLE